MDYQNKIIDMISSMDEQDPVLAKLYHVVKKTARNHRPSYRSGDVAPPMRCRNGKKS